MDALELIKHDLLNYDLEDVADSAGVTSQTLRNWINGSHGARFENLKAVAKALGYELEVIIK